MPDYNSVPPDQLAPNPLPLSRGRNKPSGVSNANLLGIVSLVLLFISASLSYLLFISNGSTSSEVPMIVTKDLETQTAFEEAAAIFELVKVSARSAIFKTRFSNDDPFGYCFELSIRNRTNKVQSAGVLHIRHKRLDRPLADFEAVESFEIKGGVNPRETIYAECFLKASDLYNATFGSYSVPDGSKLQVSVDLKNWIDVGIVSPPPPDPMFERFKTSNSSDVVKPDVGTPISVPTGDGTRAYVNTPSR